MRREEKIRQCDICTEKCPQAEMACEIAKGRMYATNEMIRLQRELQEYKDLEEQGLLLRLPCKVGDEVWYICPHWNIELVKGEIYNGIVTRVYAMKDGIIVTIRIESSYGVTEIAELDNFGKIIFLTKEEAEEALKKMREQGDERS